MTWIKRILEYFQQVEPSIQPHNPSRSSYPVNTQRLKARKRR